MFVASVAIFGILTGIKIDTTSPIIGFKFNGLSEAKLLLAMLCITAYFLFHFSWYVYEEFAKWKIRLTGTLDAFVEKRKFPRYLMDDGIYENTTLYTLFFSRLLDENIINGINELSESCIKVRNLLASSRDELKTPTSNHFYREFEDAVESINKLKANYDEIHATLTFDNMRIALIRFDNWYQIFCRSQNLRFLFIEFGLPFALGTWAIFLLIGRLNAIS